jgi:hypothetical protein
VAATAIRGGDESAVLAQAHNDNELALAAYVFGVKAMHERDFHRMMRMYQLGVSTDPTLGGNPRMLLVDELRGYAQGYSLDLLDTGFWPVADAQ